MGRAINSNGKGRASIDELLISNFAQVGAQAATAGSAGTS